MGPSFSDLAFGRNTAFSDLAFSFGVPVPPTPPIVPKVSGIGVLQYNQELRRKRILKLDDDDLDIVRVLVEFLSRQ